MKFIVFDDEITTKSVTELIEKVDADCVIYFSSVGGDVPPGNIFIDFTKKTEYKIKMVSCHNIASCAFNMFMFSNSEKEVMPYTIGIIHLMDQELHTRDTLKKDPIEMFITQRIIKENEEVLSKYAELGISAGQLKQVAHGEDVVLSTEQIIKCAKVAEKIYHKEPVIEK
jgi:ATP-dependent protease ClpP protease subunit